MHSTYTKEKEPIYFKTTEGEAVLFIQRLPELHPKDTCGLNRPIEHINRSISFEPSYWYYSTKVSS